MIKLGSKVELERLEVELDKEVREKVEEVLTILDEEYGEDRNIIKDLGGFVALIEDITDIKEPLFLPSSYLIILHSDASTTSPSSSPSLSSPRHSSTTLPHIPLRR